MAEKSNGAASNTFNVGGRSYTIVDHDECGYPLIDFNPYIFKGMLCSIVVTHVKQFNTTHANIIEHQTDDAQKVANRKHLST